MTVGRCSKVKDTCGKKINARCVDYEGDVNEDSSLIDEEGCLDMDSVTEDIYEQLGEIQNSIDTSALGDGCIEYEAADPDNLTVAEVLLGLETKICELDEATGNGEACHPIFDTDITCLNLDFDCLVDPCKEKITTFKQLLQALITQVCVTPAPQNIKR